MKYAIQNVAGQWWTGHCWGVEQAREEYRDLPLEIDNLVRVAGQHYIVWDDEDGEIVASVVPVREAGDPCPWEAE